MSCTTIKIRIALPYILSLLITNREGILFNIQLMLRLISWVLPYISYAYSLDTHTEYIKSSLSLRVLVTDIEPFTSHHGQLLLLSTPASRNSPPTPSGYTVHGHPLSTSGLGILCRRPPSTVSGSWRSPHNHKGPCQPLSPPGIRTVRGGPHNMPRGTGSFTSDHTATYPLSTSEIRTLCRGPYSALPGCWRSSRLWATWRRPSRWPCESQAVVSVRL